VRKRDRVALGLAGSLGPGLFRALYSTLRFEVSGRANQESWESGQPVVFVTWHGRLLPLLHLYRRRGIVMLVSQHRDGEYLTRLGQGLGYSAVRGSSTRGGYPALRQLVRELRDGRSLAITPDGPQGPREQFKPGALQAARITGAPVIPVMAGTDRGWWIEGWDRFLVPKPFARVRVTVGRPWHVPKGRSVAEIARDAEKLEAYMQELKEDVDHQGP
jgi:lysophospholipid acyltransferase (LPLAT)-like uncharacterized protein